jgi:methionine synthase I (cobalamin-dependent)
LGAYANRLTPVPSGWTMAESEGPQPMRGDLSPREYYDKFISSWIQDYNVQIVGGCCGITPDHIAYIRSKV